MLPQRSSGRASTGVDQLSSHEVDLLTPSQGPHGPFFVHCYESAHKKAPPKAGAFSRTRVGVLPCFHSTEEFNSSQKKFSQAVELTIHRLGQFLIRAIQSQGPPK